ncbi:MAG: TIGR00725 family protein [Fimbriimonadales bacterium]
MNRTYRRVVAVMGGSVCTPPQAELAHTVGRLLAERGAVVLCGGMTGVMEAVAQGAQSAGGLTLGLLPGASANESPPNPYIEVALFTGLREGRNYLIASACDGAIAIGGGYGTLSEIALALRMGKPLVLVDTWEFHLRGEPIEVPTATTAEEAVETLWQRMEQHR